jgi:glucans biosynthesis protein
MHGGAAGAGAPPGNRNALKHGWWSAAERAERRRAAALLDAGARMLGELAEAAG